METLAFDNRLVIYGHVPSSAFEELVEQILVDGVLTSPDGSRCETSDEIRSIAAMAESEARPLEFRAASRHVPFTGAVGVLKDYGIAFQVVAPFHANGTDFGARHHDGVNERYRRMPLHGGEPFRTDPRHEFSV